VRKKESAKAEKSAKALIDHEETATKVEGYVLLGDLDFAQSDFTGAVANYQSAHAIGAESRTILRIFAAQKALGDIDDSLFKEWLDANPNDTRVRVVAAIDDGAQGDQASAMQQYEKVLESDPTNIVALNNQAWLFDEANDDRAIEFGRRAYEAAPTRPEIMDTYGWIMLRRGSREQGIELLSRAVESAPENRDIRYHYASGLAMSEDKEQAIKELQIVLADETDFQTRDDAEVLMAKLQQ